jgi:hypothetical protein
MNLDGTEYTIYSEEDNSGFMKVSPLGDAAAIFGGKLFDTDQLFSAQSPILLNRDPDLNYKFYEPEWSPNNKFIGWSMEILPNQNRYYGIGVQDLEENTIRLIFPYLQMDGEGFPRAPDWSPDNNWLSFYSLDYDNKTMGSYIIRVDGTEEYFFEDINDIVWNPMNSNVFLIRGDYYNPSTQGVWITSFDDRERTKLNLPQDAFPVDWIDPNYIENMIGFDRDKVYWRE